MGRGSFYSSPSSIPRTPSISSSEFALACFLLCFFLIFPRYAAAAAAARIPDSVALSLFRLVSPPGGWAKRREAAVSEARSATTRYTVFRCQLRRACSFRVLLLRVKSFGKLAETRGQEKRNAEERSRPPTPPQAVTFIKFPFSLEKFSVCRLTGWSLRMQCSPPCDSRNSTVFLSRGSLYAVVLFSSSIFFSFFLFASSFVLYEVTSGYILINYDLLIFQSWHLYVYTWYFRSILFCPLASKFFCFRLFYTLSSKWLCITHRHFFQPVQLQSTT